MRQTFDGHKFRLGAKVTESYYVTGKSPKLQESNSIMLPTLKRTVNSGVFQTGVLVLIILNAIILGLETIDPILQEYGDTLRFVDRLIVYAFVLELTLRFAAEPRDFFRTGWNLFDFIIVATSLIAASSGLAAIRAFRVLRVLRVVTVIPRMRVVVFALLESIPGIASVGVVLVLILYVFSVIAATMFGDAHPALFGDVFVAMYTLFTVMTLEGWREIADAVGATHPHAWVFFLCFLLIATFTMLNLFVAIVVRVVEEDADEAMRQQTEVLRGEICLLHDKLDALLAQNQRS